MPRDAIARQRGVLILRGNDRGVIKGFSQAGLGVGWLSASGSYSFTKYYYSGDINNFKWETLQGRSNNLTISAGEGLMGGFTITWVENSNMRGEYLFGITREIGIGVGSPLSGQFTEQWTKIWP